MKAAENIESLIKKFYARQKSSVKTPAEMDKRVLDDALQAIEESDKITTADLQPNIWRTIMKTKITKLATAAAIILIALLGITFLQKSTTPAWAIKQTIEALQGLNAVHIKGFSYGENGSKVGFNLWARANEDHTQSSDFKLEQDNGQITFVHGNDTYHYDPNKNTVRIIRGNKACINPWIGAELFQTLEKVTDDWQTVYGKDPASGRERVFVTCCWPHAPKARSWWFEFDVETKLPVSFKQWHNLYREGKPNFDAQTIVYYENLPEELFEVEIPEDAVVTEEFPTAEGLHQIDDPNFGMLVENMTEDEASVEIVRRYWQAVINGHWELVAKLRPIAGPEGWEFQYSKNQPKEIIEIGESYWQDGCSIGPITPLTIKLKNGDIKEIKMITMFRDIDGESSCIIAGTWGSE